jgi:hypothetical protein
MRLLKNPERAMDGIAFGVFEQPWLLAKITANE